MNIHPICYFEMSQDEIAQFMKITRAHPLTGKQTTHELPITEQQWQKYINGAHAQDAFPHLNADEREFIISGIPIGEWDDLMDPEY